MTYCRSASALCVSSLPCFGTISIPRNCVRRHHHHRVQHNTADIFDKCVHMNARCVFMTESYGADTPGLRSYFLKSIVTLITFALNLIECCNLQLTERMNERFSREQLNNNKIVRRIAGVSAWKKRGVMIVHYLPYCTRCAVLFFYVSFISIFPPCCCCCCVCCCCLFVSYLVCIVCACVYLLLLGKFLHAYTLAYLYLYLDGIDNKCFEITHSVYRSVSE